MATVAARRFSVHPRHVARQHARVVVEASFEAAAVAFVEHFSPVPDDEAEVAILVRDLDTGVEHCFRIDLESGASAPCG
jgi:hypothetical protein